MTLSSLKRLLIAAVTAFVSVAAFAQSDSGEDALELTFAQNLERPDVPRRAEQFVRVHMDQVRRNLIKNGLEANTLRNGEVLQVTVPCEQLFATSSVELKPSASELLSKLSIIFRDPAKYKLIVAVHTDDTGDDLYADSISAARANAIDDGLWQLAGEKETNVIPYGIGKDEPLVPNTSRNNRARNRRVEFFIVPDQGLIELSGVKLKKN